MITINGKSCALFIVIELCLISCSNKIDDNLFGTCNDVSGMNEIHTIHYPPVNKIIEASEIRLAMDKAWTKMNQTATKSGRCEYGFFIYAESNGNIHAGDMVRGDEV